MCIPVAAACAQYIHPASTSAVGTWSVLSLGCCPGNYNTIYSGKALERFFQELNLVWDPVTGLVLKGVISLSNDHTSIRMIENC